MVGIQAIFRYLRPDTPTQLFEKLMHKTDHQPERTSFLTLVEWMHDDAMDARADLFASHIWDFPDGPGNPGQLKEDCKEWGMFLSLPDLDRPECDRQPGRYFDFWKFLWRMCKVHEGSVRLVGPQDDWEHRDGPPPMEKNFWHCQYATDDWQRDIQEGCECRGHPRTKEQGEVLWADNPELWPAQLLAIGSTNMCRICPDDLTLHHGRRTGIMLSYPRFLLLLVKCVGISMHVAEEFWRSRAMICQIKTRLCKRLRQGKGKGKGKGKGRK